MTRVSTSFFEVKVEGSPLPASLAQAVVEVVLDQRLMLPAQMTLTVSGLGPGDAEQVKLAVGSKVAFTVIQDTKRSELFSGTISSAEFEGSPLGQSCRIRAFDALHALTGGRKTRTFAQQKTSDIITKVLQESGAQASVSATSVVHEHVLQMDENDYDFVARLALGAGMIIRVDGKKVVVEPVPKATGSSSHGLQQAPAPLEVTVDANVITWRGRVTETESVKTVTVSGWDPVTQKEVQSSTPPASSLSKNGAKKSTSSRVLHVASPVRTTAAAKELVTGYAESVGNLQTELSIELFGAPAITAGSVITFGKVGKPFDGSYTVTHAVHRYDSDGYSTEAECASLGDRSLLGTLAGAIDRPAGRWTGAVVGIVTNVNDPKKQGRVKVAYPWLPDKPESDWARVIHLGAGQDNKKGLLIIPAVNDEVMVTFEHGSPDHPVVLGGTYNGKHLPQEPGQKGGKVTGHYWRSGAGHEIAMVDESGQEKITITSSDKDVVVTIDKGKKAVSVVAKQSKVDVDAGGPVTLKSKQDIKLEGTNITIAAKANLKLEGKATAELSASGPVTVKGAVIKLN